MSASTSNGRRRKAPSKKVQAERSYSPPMVDLTSSPPSSSASSSTLVLFFSRAVSTSTDTGRCQLCYNCVDVDTLTRHPLTDKLAIRHVRESYTQCCEECSRYVLQAYGTDSWQCDMCTSIDGFHDLISCSTCHSSMCRTCIVAHYGGDAARNVMQFHNDEPDADWQCFGCQELQQLQNNNKKKRAYKPFKFPFRTHLALTDLVSSDASLSYYNIFNPFKLERSVPGMTYHTFLHPFAQEQFRSNPARAFQSISGIDQSCPDEIVRCLRFPNEYSLHIGMNTTWRDAVTSPTVSVPMQSVQAINKVLFPNRRIMSSSSSSSPIALPSAASSSSSSSPSFAQKASTSSSLWKIVTTSIYRHAEEGSNHEKRHGGARHPVYIQGLLNVVRRFRSVFPAEENWVLRIYYDRSMEQPCPCEKCLAFVRKGKPELYPLPDAWNYIKEQLEEFPFVQLRYFNWPAYQHVQGFEDQNPSNYHLGHLGMFARFLALAELGITAQLVLFSDLDGSWSPLWKEQVDRMLENKSSVLRMSEPDYMLPLWGGATAFVYHPDAIVPLSFLGIENSMHEFCTWHLQHPELLKEHPCMALHFKQFLSNQEKKLELQWKKMELQQIGMVDVDETIDDKEVEKLYAKHYNANLPNQMSPLRAAAEPAASESKADLQPSINNSEDLVTKSASSSRRRRTPLSRSRKRVKKGQTSTFTEIGQTVGWTEEEEIEATDSCRNTCFPYGSDQAFLLYCVWNVVVEAEKETGKRRVSLPDCMENHTPQYEFIRTVPVTLPSFSKPATTEAAQAMGILCITRYLIPLSAVNPSEAEIESFVKDYFHRYMGKKFQENGFRDDAKLKRSLSNSETQSAAAASKPSTAVRSSSYSAAIPHPNGVVERRARAKTPDERKHSVNTQSSLTLQAIPEKKREFEEDNAEDEFPSTQPVRQDSGESENDNMEIEEDDVEDSLEDMSQDYRSSNKRRKLENPSSMPAFCLLPSASLTSFSAFDSTPQVEHKSQFKAKRDTKSSSSAPIHPIASRPTQATATPANASTGAKLTQPPATAPSVPIDLISPDPQKVVAPTPISVILPMARLPTASAPPQSPFLVAPAYINLVSPSPPSK